MNQAAIARRYSAALLDKATDEAEAREIQEALGVALEVLGDPQARTAVLSPSIADKDRQGVLEELSEAMQLPELVRRFLLVLFQAGRMEVLPEVGAAFRKLFEERFRLRRAVVEVAAPLEDELAEKLRVKLEALTGDRIELEFVEAPELLAGWRARVGNHLVEADLASQAERLRNRVVKG